MGGGEKLTRKKPVKSRFQKPLTRFVSVVTHKVQFVDVSLEFFQKIFFISITLPPTTSQNEQIRTHYQSI